MPKKTVYDHIHAMTIDELAEQLCKWLWWSPTKEQMLEELNKEYNEEELSI
jgi:hypothetical protein